MKTHMGVDIDEPALIEKPEVHIIARSSSSTEEQLLFVQTRRECLEQMKNTLKTATGVEIRDVVRFFLW